MFSMHDAGLQCADNDNDPWFLCTYLYDRSVPKRPETRAYAIGPESSGRRLKQMQVVAWLCRPM
jgi:hypothetical protein